MFCMAENPGNKMSRRDFLKQAGVTALTTGLVVKDLANLAHTPKSPDKGELSAEDNQTIDYFLRALGDHKEQTIGEFLNSEPPSESIKAISSIGSSSFPRGDSFESTITVLTHKNVKDVSDQRLRYLAEAIIERSRTDNNAITPGELVDNSHLAMISLNRGNGIDDYRLIVIPDPGFFSPQSFDHIESYIEGGDLTTLKDLLEPLSDDRETTQVLMTDPTIRQITKHVFIDNPSYKPLEPGIPGRIISPNQTPI